MILEKVPEHLELHLPQESCEHLPSLHRRILLGLTSCLDGLLWMITATLISDSRWQQLQPAPRKQLCCTKIGLDESDKGLEKNLIVNW